MAWKCRTCRRILLSSPWKERLPHNNTLLVQGRDERQPSKGHFWAQYRNKRKTDKTDSHRWRYLLHLLFQAISKQIIKELIQYPSIAVPIELQFPIGTELDLDWRWIGLELELLRPYIEKQARQWHDSAMNLFIAVLQKKSFSHFSCHTVILIVYQCVMRDRKVVFLSHCRHKAMCVWQERDRRNILLSHVIDWYSKDVTVWQENQEKIKS